ncbi:MAG: hypothetical protein WA830_00780 [Candidatus Sulfotelmatobacter sp.]
MILGPPLRFLAALVCIALPADSLRAQTQTPSPPSSSSSSAKHVKPPAAPRDSGLDAGTVTNGVYRNKSLALSCAIPPGWVLRTDEMNAPEEKRQEEEKQEKDDTASAKPPAPPASSVGAKVLLAAFSRPPEAKGEDVNASILIAAESASSYPGLKDPAQYFGPLTEVAKAQGFTVDEEPYEFAVGAKTLVRGDFHKDVGARVLRQSTLTMLAHGYAISITVIGGTEDEVEGLIDGLTFTPSGK